MPSAHTKKLDKLDKERNKRIAKKYGTINAGEVTGGSRHWSLRNIEGGKKPAKNTQTTWGDYSSANVESRNIAQGKRVAAMKALFSGSGRTASDETRDLTKTASRAMFNGAGKMDESASVYRNMDLLFVEHRNSGAVGYREATDAWQYGLIPLKGQIAALVERHYSQDGLSDPAAVFAEIQALVAPILSNPTSALFGCFAGTEDAIKEQNLYQQQGAAEMAPHFFMNELILKGINPILNDLKEQDTASPKSLAIKNLTLLFQREASYGAKRIGKSFGHNVENMPDAASPTEQRMASLVGNYKTGKDRMQSPLSDAKQSLLDKWNTTGEESDRAHMNTSSAQRIPPPLSAEKQSVLDKWNTTGEESDREHMYISSPTLGQATPRIGTDTQQNTFDKWSATGPMSDLLHAHLLHPSKMHILDTPSGRDYGYNGAYDDTGFDTDTDFAAPAQAPAPAPAQQKSKWQRFLSFFKS